MLKSKGLIVGTAIAVVACALLVGGFAVTSTQGAATDVPQVGGGPSGFPTDNGNTGTPPQSPPEVPAPPATTDTTTPAINPDGSVGNNNGGPGGTSALPNAGYGVAGTDNTSTIFVLLAAAGLALVFAGGAVVAAGRRD